MPPSSSSNHPTSSYIYRWLLSYTSSTISSLTMDRGSFCDKEARTKCHAGSVVLLLFPESKDLQQVEDHRPFRTSSR